MVLWACTPAGSSLELETPLRCNVGSWLGQADAPILSLPPAPTKTSSDELICIALGGLFPSPSTVFGAIAIDPLEVADAAVSIASDLEILITGGTHHTQSSTPTRTRSEGRSRSRFAQFQACLVVSVEANMCRKASEQLSS